MRKTVMAMAIAGVLAMGALPAFAATDASMSKDDAQALCTKLTTQFEFLAVGETTTDSFTYMSEIAATRTIRSPAPNPFRPRFPTCM